MAYAEQAEIERFNRNWRSVKDCHIWQNSLDRDGYGHFYFRKKNRCAHRFAYYITNGDIPTGMMIDHICKNRNCVNIKHLRIVTPKQNTLENSNSVGAINKAKTHCKNKHPFDRKYGKQRYCSKCQAEKNKRLHKKWLEEANKIKC